MTRIRASAVRAATLAWLPVTLIVIWWVVSAGSHSLYFPPLSTIVTAGRQGFADGTLPRALAYSMINYGFGLLIATVLGVSLGLVLGDHARWRSATNPLLTFIRATPQVSFVPVVILALGVNRGPKVLLITLACTWPILLNTIDGVRAINPAVLETGRAFRIPNRLRLMRITLMGALPQIFAGLRIAVSVGLVMLVISEIYGSTQGIGHYILYSEQTYAVDQTWAGTLLIGIVGYLLSLALVGLERVSLRWYFAQQTSRPARLRRRRVRLRTDSPKPMEVVQ
jgi:sulfonate transport system permease protein